MLIKTGVDVLTTASAGRDNKQYSDHEQLEFAAREGRVFVTYDSDLYAVAREWTREGRSYPGILVCPQLPSWELLPRFQGIFELYPEDFPLGLVCRLP